MENQDKILQIVRMKGPLLPSQINKELNTNVLFASAMLGELVDNKKLKLTHMKIGGSPLYYIPSQESKLQNFADKLGSKEKETYDLLKNNKILIDSKQEPYVRVALRTLKDFAYPLEVSFGDTKEILWKWYILPENEVESLIKQKMGFAEEKKEKMEEIKQEVPEKDEFEDEIKLMIEEKKKELEKLRQAEQKIQELKEEEKVELKEEKKQETEKEEPEVEAKNEVKKEEPKTKEVKKEIKEERKEKKAEKTEQLKEFVQQEEPDDGFYRQIKEFFKEKDIKIAKHKIIRKNTDIELDIGIPSPIGILAYFCKAKNKKKCNNGDLSSAYITGQTRKLPVLFLTTGDITKKALELSKKEFKNMKIHNL